MSTEVEQQLVGMLQALQKLKPPGASKGKIADITSLCIDNIQYSAMIIDKLTMHFHATPATHKLGVLFVVDSVTRQWIEKAKGTGQSFTEATAPEGSFAAGVHMMSRKVASFVKEMIATGPTDQKAKVISLVDIWRRGHTFPSKIAELESICKQSTSSEQVVSRTPPGSPPKALLASLGIKTSKSQRTSNRRNPLAVAPTSAAPPPPTDAASILAALAGVAQSQPLSAPVPLPQATPGLSTYPVNQQPQNLAAILGGLDASGLAFPPPPAPMSIVPPVSYQAAGVPPTYSAMGGSTPFGVMPPASMQMFSGPPPPSQAAQTALPAPDVGAGIEALTSMIPPHVVTDVTKLTEVLTLFQELLKAGIPQDQWRTVVEQVYPPVSQPGQPNSTVDQQPAHRDFPLNNGRGEHSHGRRRSRSPDRSTRGGGINRRPSPVYGTYSAPVHNGPQAGGDPSSANSYRQRSPLGARVGNDNVPRGPRQKWTDLDRSLPPNHIKVLSRTLFVGGVNCSEADLRAIFSEYGRVQTCVINLEKRHAFVKMFTREDAVRAREGMAHNVRVYTKARMTRWGVGFGPRDCCDYTSGESTIPIDRLTDADHKWVLSAEVGGTGGRPIESGLVMEEPDIEIGAGVSSKAMSRRVGPEGSSKRGGADLNQSQDHNQNLGNQNQGYPNHGNNNNRGGHGGARVQGDHGHGRQAHGGGRGRASHRGRGGGHHQSPQEERPAVQPPPEVPQFGSFQMSSLGSGLP